jgi:hypothetical protein
MGDEGMNCPICRCTNGWHMANCSAAKREDERLTAERNAATQRIWGVADKLTALGIDPSHLIEFIEFWQTKDF